MLIDKNRIARLGAPLFAALIAFAAPATVSAAEPAANEYALVQPAQPTDNAAKVEVIEFFSYGCPHCSEFHPTIARWAAKQPKDVDFKRVPVTFGRPAWANLARLFYSLEATGDLARLDGAVFEAIHEQHVSLFDESAIGEWVAKQGIDAKKFAAVYHSFGVNSKLARADQLAQAYRVEGVPSIYVDGRFRIVAEGHGFDELLARTDRVVDKVRAEKNPAAKAKGAGKPAKK